ncbi:taurine ABC transporter permease TauC [Chitiniphilus eburneus]|uniref:Taurine ABC transporter permease TauC n=1 Tax=Chitiniphilus eburneus TaxID=2571148 RepID=A0A4U0Q0S8_9NEIS|nr:taurine ABC transporter permease TauC [Chitiniphilus eburneus]TJZ74190.1 taurine ABC transporter permease TauC [Chitiniphilus eburneus]
MNAADLALGEHEFPVAEQAEPQRPPRRGTLRLGVTTVATLLALWWAVSASGLIPPLFLPPPQAVLAKLWLTATQGYMDATLWQHLGASALRIVLALIAAMLFAVPVGIAIGLSRTARGVLDPLIEFYRPIPPLAYLPLIVIWFGIGELSKVLLIYLAIFAPIAIATATGVRGVDPARVRAAQSLGASRWQLIRHVIVPSALPDILTGVRIGLGTGWSTLVAAELVAATRGLGFMVQSAAQFLVTDVVVLGILVIAVIAFALELGLRALQRRLVPWQGQPH